MVEYSTNWWSTPTVSPNCNPIENVWASKKAFLCKSELRGWDSSIWKTLTPKKCQILCKMVFQRYSKKTAQLVDIQFYHSYTYFIMLLSSCFCPQTKKNHGTLECSVLRRWYGSSCSLSNCSEIDAISLQTVCWLWWFEIFKKINWFILGYNHLLIVLTLWHFISFLNSLVHLGHWSQYKSGWLWDQRHY